MFKDQDMAALGFVPVSYVVPLGSIYESVRAEIAFTAGSRIEFAG
jgi:hypothetical protein